MARSPSVPLPRLSLRTRLVREAMSAPILIVAALWTDGDRADEVAKALHEFAQPDGFLRGSAVSFHPCVADAPDFAATMRRLQLAEANVRPRGWSFAVHRLEEQ